MPGIPSRNTFWISGYCGAGFLAASDLEQEPMATFCLVDPIFYQTGSGNIPVLITNLMCCPERSGQFLVVSGEFRQHVFRRYKFAVVVLQALVFRDVADGAERGAADLSRPLGDIIRHFKDLVAMIIKEQMVIAKMASTHVPVEILRLEVQREDVCQEMT